MHWTPCIPLEDETMPLPTHALSSLRRAAALGAFALAAAGATACMPDAGADPNSSDSPAGGNDTPPGYAPAVEPSGARRVMRIDGFLSPESVKYDAQEDAYYVTNILGYGSVKDDNGYIVKVDAKDWTMQILAEGGKNGVTLDAPKGTALHGDTLWVADIDHLRGFDRRNGRMLADVDFSPYHALMLNDVEVGPDGSVHVTDTGIHMTDKGVIYTDSQTVFVLGPNRSVSVQAQGPALGHPNGIKWDAKNKRWIVVSFDAFRSDVYAMKDGDTTRTVLGQGVGRFDGLELLDDGRLLVTCWNDSTVHAFSPGKDEKVVRHLSQPADLGLDTKRNRIAVPLGMLGRVEVWQLPTKEQTVAQR
jgi:sugar lactone lactonase YvrE